MLIKKIKDILNANRYGIPPRYPSDMTQLSHAMNISDKWLRELINKGRPNDIERIAKGLGIDPTELN